MEGEQLALEETTYREMRTKLENMGPVNMMALEEFKETEKRHQFLETQRKDLLESIENTQATIKEIDEVSRQKFEEAFDRINENFQFTFRKLFGGGQAFMRLTDEGTRRKAASTWWRRLRARSCRTCCCFRAERRRLRRCRCWSASSSISRARSASWTKWTRRWTKPTSGASLSWCREMAVQTQFIIITHSKKTMSIAPVMYGVTMQEPGVSKIVSVKFGAESGMPRAASA